VRKADPEEEQTLMSGEMVKMDVPVELAGAVELLKGLLAGVRGGAVQDVEGQILDTVDGVKGELNVAVVGELMDRELEADQKEVPCPECGKAAKRIGRSEPRHATMRTGKVKFRRSVYECTPCGRHRAPLDALLGLEGKETLTPRVQELAAWLVAYLNCKTASEGVEKLTALSILPKQVHRVLERVGERAVRLQEAEVARLCAPVSPSRPIKPLVQSGSAQVIELDGTNVMGRDGRGHEVKCVTTYLTDDRVIEGGERAPRKCLLNRRYGVTTGGVESFSMLAWATAVLWGVLSGRVVILIGDGAPWIWKWSREKLHRVLADGTKFLPVEILDFWHACEHLAKARDALASRLAKGAGAWYERWKEALREGGVVRLIAELREHAPLASEEKDPGTGDSPRAILERCIAYFEEHKERMRYDVFRANGYPIGSGAIEGTCKHLVKGRLDGVGMRWKSPEGIERILALRTLLFNNEWQSLWDHPTSLDHSASLDLPSSLVA
jgi:hypothetical protein